MNIYFLHGFLGLPSDFERTMHFLEVPGENSNILSVDYLKFRETSSQVSLSDWGGQFNRWIQSYEKGQTNKNPKRILVGYSQGGRLALQAVHASPQFWQGLILISANPGIPSGERPARLKRDQVWGERFLQENFDKTVEKWNAQPVFQGSMAEPQRQESNYNRNLLAGCLTQWSLGHQQDFKSVIKDWQIPMLYMAGEKDSKYVQIGQELKKAQPSVKLSVIPQAGHRVILDAPDALAHEISNFIK